MPWPSWRTFPGCCWRSTWPADRPARRQRAAADLARSACLTGSQLLLGYPQYVWFSLLGGSRVCRVAHCAGKSRAVAGRLARWWPPIVRRADRRRPTAADDRRAAELDAAALPTRRLPTTGSLHPLNLVQLVAPYLFQTRVVGQNTHELGLYAGAVPLLLCVWLLAQRAQLGPAAAAGAGRDCARRTALAVGLRRVRRLYRCKRWLPLVNRFRFPCRAIVLVQLCDGRAAAVALAILLAVANAAEQRARRSNAGAAIVRWSCSLASVGCWRSSGRWSGPSMSARRCWCGAARLLIGVAAGLVTLAERGARGRCVALVLFTAVDLCVLRP